MPKIYLFTNTYPFGNQAETFLADELSVADKMGLDIVLIPLHQKKNCRSVPSRFAIDLRLCSSSVRLKMIAFLRLLISKWLWKLPFTSDRPRSMNEYYQGVKYLMGAFLVESYVSANKNSFDRDGIFYSYWFNHTPLGLYRVKCKHDQLKNISIYTRAHGFDVYERRVGIYIPYREWTLNGLKSVFVVSQMGCDFLRDRYPGYKDRIAVSRLGVIPMDLNIKSTFLSENKISFVSCSSVIPLKRVHLIFETISNYSKSHPDTQVCWTHIGGGADFESLKKYIHTQAKSKNLEIILCGEMSNTKVKETYGSARFDIFVNLSISEGVPVSIMEAISTRIPVIATNVGGMREIVTKETGFLLPVNFTQAEFDKKVHEILLHMDDYRRETYGFFQKNFNADINYSYFYQRQLI